MQQEFDAPVIASSKEDGAAKSAKQSYIVIKNRRSFMAKLIQADDETKRYYSELKNEIMSYRLKSRISWRHEGFRAGRQLLVKMLMRGKTLTLCFALSPSYYTDSKYKTEDYSDVALFQATPCVYRIKNERRCSYAKDLISDVMEKYGIDRVEDQNVPYAEELAYESLDDLIARGLIEELPDEEAQSNLNNL